jgi:dimethylargininase
VERALESRRKLLRIEPPDTLDGGDVLTIGRTLYVGLTRRTGPGAVAQMERMLRPFNYKVQGVEVSGCLHLKSAASFIGDHRVLCNPAWVDRGIFKGMDIIETDPSESHAANGLLVGETLLYPETFPKTLERIRARGIRVLTVDLSELAKAEGAVTCCSLIIKLSQ